MKIETTVLISGNATGLAEEEGAILLRTDRRAADSFHADPAMLPGAATPPLPNAARLTDPSQENTGARLSDSAHETPDRRAPFAPSKGSAHPHAADYETAQRLANHCERYLELVRSGYSLRQASMALGRSPSFFSGADSPLARYQRGGLAALLPQPREEARPTSLDVPAWFVPAAQFFYLMTNRGRGQGSVPEAIRRTISLPNVPPGWTKGMVQRLAQKLAAVLPLPAGEGQGEGEALAENGIPICPKELREKILARQKAGLPLVPQSLARQITISRTLMEHHRNPKNAMLNTINAAGCSRFTRVNGEYEPLRAGQRMQPDDGSVNFCVCVPWRFPTDTCSRKFGVLVGRFQLLLFVDALSLAIRARSFVVRPRSSYRQEDALHLYNIFMRQHGVPDEIWHEGHVWNAGRVKECLDLVGVRRHLVHSPHNKAAVEGRFNKLWTVLSTLSGGQIGRYRGEMQRENELLTSCRAGHTDPRRVFPLLSPALAAIDHAINEANATPVRTNVGSWIPDELWDEHQAEKPLRKLEAEHQWMFAPWMKELTINNGFNTKVRLFEDFSVPFTFAAEFMPQFHGARAKCYFDPYADRCRGMIVLAQNFNGVKAGTVLGEAKQTNDIADYARLMLGVGSGPSEEGRVMRQRQASALRSERRAILGSGNGLTISEERDGISQVAKLEREPATPEPDPDRLERAARFEHETNALDFY